MAVQHGRLGKHGVLVSDTCLGTMNSRWHRSEEDSFRIMGRALAGAGRQAPMAYTW